MQEGSQQDAGQQPVAETQDEQRQAVTGIQYGQNVQPAQGKGMGVASLVLGILSLVFVLTGFGSFLAIVTSVVGIVLGSMARKRLPPGERGMATAGFVCSIIALVLSVLVLLLLGGTLGALMMMR